MTKCKVSSKITLPFLIRIGVLLFILGFTFPVYGIPLGVFKLTFWRLGMLMLIPLTITYWPLLSLRSKMATTVVAIFILFGLWRLASLIIVAPEKSFGLQQLIWFFEGIVFLSSLLVLQSRFPQMQRFVLRAVFIIGFTSIGVMAFQFFMLSFGLELTLPLSDSAFGISEDIKIRYGYPLIGGRIIGAFMDPNMAGTMCAFYFASFMPFLLFQSKLKVASRQLLILSMLLTMIAITGTGSRQSVVIMAISFVVMAFLRGRQPLILLIRIAPIVIVLSVLLIIYSIWAPKDSLLESGGTQQTIFSRFSQSRDLNELTGRRLEFSEAVLNQITTEIFVFGIGEGMAMVAMDEPSHNAYIITLLETGVIGILILLLLSLTLLVYSCSALRRTRQNIPATSVAAFCVALSWIFFILFNWAQLNQSISFLFLGLLVLSFAQDTRQMQAGVFPKTNTPTRTAYN